MPGDTGQKGSEAVMCCIVQARDTVVAQEHVHWAVRISQEESGDPWSYSNPLGVYTLYFPVCHQLLQKPDSRLCDVFYSVEVFGVL